jgi:GT2 family glycosyltransferase
LKIATLLTCHNRKEKTLACLEALYQNRLPRICSLEVFLVDDGSTDGTEQAVREHYPKVKLIKGDGNLFWNGGMRVAFAAAIEGGFDYYLWLNDDTLLKPRAIAEMLMAAQKHLGIIVGSCHDPDTGEWTYGGRATANGKKSLKGAPVIPSAKVQLCQQINGNVVLVPRSVVDRIGNLSDSFTHAIGDYDYGFRAMDAGIPIYVAPHYQGMCPSNPLPGWCNPTTPLRIRLKLLNNPKGIHFSEFMKFSRQHFGNKAFLIGIKIIIRILLPELWHVKQLKNK